MFAEEYLLEFSCLHPSLPHLPPLPKGWAHLVFTLQQASLAFSTLSVMCSVFKMGQLKHFNYEVPDP